MKRFYKAAGITRSGDGWCVVLDGRKVQTAGKNPQIVPTKDLANAMADEWNRQDEEIDPSAFALRDLADLAIDTVAADPVSATRKILRYAETDTLLYRAEESSSLCRHQQEMWDPLVREVEAWLDISLARINGIVHQPQPVSAIAALRHQVTQYDHFTLAGLQVLCGLGASLLAGLYAIEHEIKPQTLWQIVNLEEDWQARTWGQDSLAQKHTAERFSAFASAMKFIRLVRCEMCNP